MLTGQPPFTGTLYEIFNKILTIPAPSVRGLNPGISEILSGVVARCLEKEPEKRFQSVRELLANFKACFNSDYSEKIMNKISIGSYLGRYRVTDELGHGGMGTVYLGEDQKLGRYVAIKVLLPDDGRSTADDKYSPNLIKRFEDEARAAACLVDDPRIIQIYDIGKYEESGTPYIVMEYVKWKLLGNYINENIPDSKTMIWRLDKFQEILEAMAYAHENGVVHRDLKPGNIMISNSGSIKIMDFGLALINNKHAKTKTGQFMGSLSYASPEQVKDSKSTDERTDIYSLGVILYELLTGQLPFTGTWYEICNKILTVSAPSVRELNHGISEDLANVVACCLKKDPEKRFQSVQELLTSLKSCPEKRWKKPITECTDPKSRSLGQSDQETNIDLDAADIESAIVTSRSTATTYGRIQNFYGSTVVENYANKQVGDRFEFGRYTQGVNGEIEPVAWRVLQRDSDSLLVIAEQGLGAKSYNEEWVDVTWSDCALRRWLNEEFFEKAFNEQEQSLIKTSRISNNSGPSTKDHIFLLSIDEAESLFANANDRMCKPTDYALNALKNGANVKYINDKCAGSVCWWLRSRGGRDVDAALVGNFGSVLSDGILVGYDFIGFVRPALRLAI